MIRYFSGKVSEYSVGNLEDNNFYGNTFVEPSYNFAQMYLPIQQESKPYGFWGYPQDDTPFMSIGDIVTGYVDHRIPYNYEVVEKKGCSLYSDYTSLAVNPNNYIFRTTEEKENPDDEEKIYTNIEITPTEYNSVIVDVDNSIATKFDATTTKVYQGIYGENNTSEIVQEIDSSKVSVTEEGGTTSQLNLDLDTVDFSIEEGANKSNVTMTDSDIEIKTSSGTDSTITMDNSSIVAETGLSQLDLEQALATLKNVTSVELSATGLQYNSGALKDFLAQSTPLISVLTTIIQAINEVNAAIPSQAPAPNVASELSGASALLPTIPSSVV